MTSPKPAEPSDAQEPRRFQRILPWVVLGVALVVQAWVSTTLYRDDANWFISPDDHEAYFFTRVVAETGLPVWNSDLDTGSEHAVNMPRGSVFVHGHVTTHRGVGIFYAAAPFYMLDEKLPFLAPAVFGLGATVVVFAIAQEIAGRTAAGIAAVLFATSGPVLFWGNFLFSNIVVLPVFLGGIYLLLLAERMERPRLALRLAGLFVLWIAGWFRTEFWLFAAIIAAVFAVGGKEWFRLRSLAPVAVVGVLLIGLTAGGLHALYGTVNPTVNADPDLVRTVPMRTEDRSMIERLFGDIEPERIGRSIIEFGLKVSLVFGIGLAALALLRRDAPMLRRPRSYSLFAAVASAIALFSFTFFAGNIYNTGFGVILGSSYVRYFLPALALLSVPAALLLVAFAARGGMWRAGFVLIVLALHVVAGVGLARDPQRGIDAMEKRIAGYKAIEDGARGLPEDAVIVGDYPGRMILARPVVSPQFIPPESRAPELIRIVRHLDAAGHTVYLVKGWSTSDQSGNVEEMLAHDPGIMLIRLPGSNFIEVRIAPEGGSP